jgi:hypothetical protein
MVQLFAILAGIIVILLVLQDVFEVLLLPRKVARRRRLVSTVLRPTWKLWRRAADLLGGGVRPVFVVLLRPARGCHLIRVLGGVSDCRLWTLRVGVESPRGTAAFVDGEFVS